MEPECVEFVQPQRALPHVGSPPQPQAMTGGTRTVPTTRVPPDERVILPSLAAPQRSACTAIRSPAQALIGCPTSRGLEQLFNDPNAIPSR